MEYFSTVTKRISPFEWNHGYTYYFTCHHYNVKLGSKEETYSLEKRIALLNKVAGSVGFQSQSKSMGCHPRYQNGFVGRLEMVVPWKRNGCIIVSLLMIQLVISSHSFQTVFVYPPIQVYEAQRLWKGGRKFRITAPVRFAATKDSNAAIHHDDAMENVIRLKDEAARLRLVAEKMDWELTIEKVNSLEKKVSKLKKRFQKHFPNQTSEDIRSIEEEYRLLRMKLETAIDVMNNTSIDSGTDDRTIPKTRSIGGNVTFQSNERTPGNFLAAATATLGKSDVPLAATAIEGTDRAMLSSSGSVFATQDISAIRSVPAGKQKPASTKPAITPQGNVLEGNDDEEILCGFDKVDLELYIPVAMNIEATMSNATADERLEAFRASPILQDNFKQKLSQLLIEPIQDMSRLEELKLQYLDSTSSKEKELLKRQIDALTSSLEENGPFTYSDSVYGDIPELSVDAMQARINAVGALPEVLQTLYRKRHNLESDANVTLAILLDYYELQLQLLEQVKEITPLTAEARLQVIQALESLPSIVRDHVATAVGLNKETYTVNELVVELSKNDDDDDNGDFDWNPWNQIMAATTSTSSKVASLTEMDWVALGNTDDDIEIVDRSRYVFDCYPSIARMDGDVSQVSKETAEKFALHVLDKKAFMVTNKVERVVGGYYIRGRNLIDEDGSGTKLMTSVHDKLRTMNSLFGSSEEFEYFYVRDPAPLTDEEIELEYRNDPLFVLTGKNPKRFYNYANPVPKAAISTLALASLLYFATDALGLNQILLGRFEAAIGLSTVGYKEIDVGSMISNLSQVVLPLILLQLVHEVGHRFVAWRDKVIAIDAAHFFYVDVSKTLLISNMFLRCFFV
jgi:ribosome-associated translation inhibitor RaiA